jgi:hypothetical protein
MLVCTICGILHEAEDWACSACDEMDVSYDYCGECCREHTCPISKTSPSLSPSSSSSPSNQETSHTKGKSDAPEDLQLASYLRGKITFAALGNEQLIQFFHERGLDYITFYNEEETKKIAHFELTEEWVETSTAKLYLIQKEEVQSLGLFDGEFAIHSGATHSKKDMGCFYLSFGKSVVQPETFLRFYVGEIHEEDDTDKEYAMALFSTHEGNEREKWTVDCSKSGNEMRFINHSHLPNVESRLAYMTGLHGTFPCVVSLDVLKDQTELVVDYGYHFDTIDDFTLHPCKCKAPFCCHVIGSREKEDPNQSYVTFVRRTSTSARVSCHVTGHKLSREYPEFVKPSDQLFYGKRIGDTVLVGNLQKFIVTLPNQKLVFFVFSLLSFLCSQIILFFPSSYSYSYSSYSSSYSSFFSFFSFFSSSSSSSFSSFFSFFSFFSSSSSSSYSSSFSSYSPSFSLFLKFCPKKVPEKIARKNCPKKLPEKIAP